MPDRLGRLYYGFVLLGGKVLKRLMWQLIGLRRPNRRIHPKHLALPAAHHNWYLPRIQPGFLVLDLGCKRGGHMQALVGAGANAVGLEISREDLKNAVRAPAARYLRADLESPLPFADHSFDAVLALDILEHLHARRQFLDEIARVIKPGGSVFLSAPNRATAWKTTARALGLFEMSDPDHKIEYEKSDLIEAVEASGLTVHSVEPVVYDTPWDAWIDFLGGLSLSLYRAAWHQKRLRAMRDPEQSTGFRIVATRTQPPKAATP